MQERLSFADFFDILTKKSQEITNELEDIITVEVKEAPSLTEVKDTDTRYVYYSQSVNLGLKLGRLISNAYFTKDASVKVKYKLQKDTSAPPKLLSQYIRDVDALIQELENIIQSAKSYKEGVDNLIRFYQNTCYMFGGIFDVKSSI